MKTATGTTLITNGQLIDGTGSPPFATPPLVIDDGRITYAGPAPRRPPVPPDARRIDARGGTIMPGLVEAHFHPTYFNVAALEDLDIKYPVEYVTLLAAANAKLALECGYTAARSGGSLFNIDVWLKKAIENDLMPGPAPGRQRPRDLRRRRADGLEPRLPQDRHGGPGAARQRPRRGPRRRAQAGQGRRRVGQDLSHRRRRRPGHQRPSHAVHDLRGDARRRRHGPQPQPEGDRPLPRDRGHQERPAGRLRHASSTARSWTTRRSTCCWSATRRCVPALQFELASIERGPEFGMPQRVIDGHKETLEGGAESARMILKAGGRLGMGGDYGFAWNPHGDYAKELTFFVKYVGFTPLETITCATKTGAEIMGRGDEFGTLEPGKLADVLVVDGDVLADIRVLEDRSRFLAVMQGGIVKAGRLATAS